MLGKLMKYEWKATWKLLLSANGLTLVMTALAWGMIKLMESENFYSEFSMLDFIAVMVLLTYVLSMFAVYVGTVIYLIHRFYTSAYSDQGYLLHTLPVDTHQIIVAKLFVSAAWLLIDIAFMYLSVVFLVASTGDVFRSMMRGMESTIEYLGAEKITAFTVLMTLIAFVFALFAKVLKVGACISLGQLSANHKLMASFGWYVLTYVAENLLQGVYMAVQLSFRRRIGDSVYYSTYFDNQWETTLIAAILSCVVYYILTWYMMSRKLNLE
ncbi:MAG: hypothetical protein NC302_05540 [Bacteroidales bacterium]|nr:hypothetical protein [Bacteroidales bacterium]MCM1415473.1 hypothetical protein [bacterium]MCM1423410.1 hypothetical protein [bacterium]